MNNQEEQNRQQFLEVLRKFDPELYLIKVALEETGLNPGIIPRIIRSIGNLAFGTGYGRIQIFMQARTVSQVKSEESDEINQRALIDNM